MEDFVDEVRQGKLSAGIISRVVQAMPELSTFTTGMGRTHALAVLRACAEGATSLGDRHNAGRYLKSVRDSAFTFLQEDRDDPFQLIYTRTYVDASNATGLEERAEARAQLWSIIEDEPEHNMALFAARSELALDMFRNGERAECGLQFANLREQFEESSAARWRSDPAVAPFIRAQIALARAHADFQLAHLSTALEQFKAIAEEFADIREVSELASYLVAMTTYLANQGDPEAGIAAFEQYAKEHPGSWLLDKALYQLALRYHTNHDFEAASEVYLQLIQTRPESDLVKHARGAAPT
ncbi:MAG: hypothetical protein HC888_13180 [Candidatus Competibacteraceae bacterium]|nr:hypothetical protein [Candidatus Competibacteraceae bacterium]